MQVLSSLSSIPFYAPSAGFAPTNSADVSAIASAYAESAASGKQDELEFSYDDGKISAINGSALAGGGGGATGDYLSAVNVDSNLTGDGTTASAIGLNTQIALDGTSSYIRLTNSAAAVPTFAQMVSNATNGMISVSGNKANIQATGKATANFSFNCDTSGQASMLSGPWLSTKNWAGVSSYYKNGSAAITVRASGSNNPTITLTGADGNSVIYLSSIPYWNAKLDESASAQFQLSGDYLSATESANYQTTADMSGYMPTSLSSDFQQVTGMSSYVPYSSLEYNTASAISGINGSALAAGSTYSAGEGIDITDDIISVETPVDIVAGPGIVIDNPDGNTLRVSVAQNVNKVLWTGSMWDSNRVANLEEPASNFEYVLLYGYAHEAPSRGCAQVFPISGNSYASLNCGNLWYSDYLCYNASSTVLNLSGHNHAWVNGGTVTTGSDGLVITKIVGCARTASAQ